MPVATAAVASAVLVVVTQRHGVSLSPDSAAYLSTAAHLLGGSGLTSYTGHTVVVFPPGFPTLISVIGRLLSVDVATAARILNVVCLAVAVAAACVLVRRHVESRPLQLAGCAAFAAAPPLVEVAAHAWSEPVFIAVSLLAVLAIEDLLERPTRLAFIAVAILVSAAFLVRYAGLALVPTAVGSLLVGGRAVFRKARLLPNVVAGAALVAVPALWIGRNVAVAGTPFGGRTASYVHVSGQLQRTGRELARWVVPGFLPIGLRLVGIGLFAAAALAVAARTTSSSARPERRPLMPLVFFSASYLLLIAVTLAVTRIDPIGARLLSPLFVPLVVIALALVDRVRGGGRRNARFIALTLGVLPWAALSVVAGAKRGHELAAGDGYTSSAWRNSALAMRLRHSPPASLLFSNRPDAVWATTRRDARCLPPQLGADLCVGSSGSAEDIGLLEPGPTHAEFAWFVLGARSAPPRRLGPIRFQLKTSTTDGALFTLAVQTAPRPPR